MGHTILNILLYIWIIVSVGFTLIAKWSHISKFNELIMKSVAIAAFVWMILDMLNIKY